MHLISIILPSFNHLAFLEKRLQSIFNQTFQNFELIIIDDFSEDGSWEYLKKFENHSKVSHCIRNNLNSGSPFFQWRRGFELSKGELVWIAESDDFSDLTFLEKAVSYFDSIEIGMVMAGSIYVDKEDQIIGIAPLDCLPNTYNGSEFVQSYMYFKNPILNASAVLFRKNFVEEFVLNQICNFRLSGDHLFWSGLLKNSNIVILNEFLNFFRWHEQSVRNKELRKLTGLKEGIRIKFWMEKEFEIQMVDKIKSRKEAYLTYSKFINQNLNSKNWNEFREISSFFSPIDRFKSWIRFFYSYDSK